LPDKAISSQAGRLLRISSAEACPEERREHRLAATRINCLVLPRSNLHAREGIASQKALATTPSTKIFAVVIDSQESYYKFLVPVFSQGLAHRRGFDKLRTRAEDGDDFHEKGEGVRGRERKVRGD